MIYLRSTLLFLSLGFLLLSCGGERDVEGNTVTLQGFITSDVGGQGVATAVVGAVIGVVEINGLGTTSDVQGNYLLTGVPIGLWTVRFVDSTQNQATPLVTQCVIQVTSPVSLFLVSSIPENPVLGAPFCALAFTATPGLFILNVRFE